MCKNNKQIKINYLLFGTLIGILGLITTIYIIFSITDTPFQLTTYFKWHNNKPLLFILDIFPILGLFLGYYIGVNYTSQTEKLYKKLKTEAERSKGVLIFLNSLRKGKTDIELQLTDDDKIGKSLISLRDELKKNKEDDAKRREEDDHRSWANEGIAKFATLLRESSLNLSEFAYTITFNLVKYVEANQGYFYLLRENDEYKNDKEASEEDKYYFELMATYAWNRKKYKHKQIKWGEGLVGACAREKQTIFLSDVPDNYVEITSGVGKANPRNIILLPLKFNDEMHGVIEMASFNVWENYIIHFLEKTAESIASTISTAKINEQTAILLEESRQQADRMAQQEETMRQNMEELRATQEEASKQGEQFKNFTNSVNHTLIRAEFATDGTLLYGNVKFLDKLEYASNSEVEGQNISMFIDNKDRSWFSEIWDRLAEGGKHHEGDIKLITKRGHEIWTAGTFVCVRNAEGMVLKILFLGIDITDKKKENLDYEGQIEALDRSSIKAEFYPDGNFIKANNLFIQVFKYKRDEIKSKNIFVLFPDDFLIKFDIIFKNVLNGVPYMGEMQMLTKMEKAKWIRGTISNVNDMYGDVEKIIFIGNDITEQKEMELEVKEQNKKLKTQEEELRASGEKLSKRLQQARLEMKEQFKEIEKIKIRNEKTLEGALDAIFTIDQSGVVQFFNKAAEDLWQMSRDHVLGQHIRNLFDKDDIKNDDFVRALVYKDEQKIVGERKEVYIKPKDDEKQSVLILLSEAEVDGEHTYTAFIQQIEVELF